MPYTQSIPRLALPALFTAFIILASAYSLTLPLGESADEVSHHAYVMALLQEARLPLVAGPAIGEAHQPPLYYLLLAGVARLVPDPVYSVQANPDFQVDDPATTPNILLHPRAEDWPYRNGVLAWHLMRLVSVLLGAVTVWATYRLGRLVFPADAPLALGAAAFVAFLPSFLLVGGVVNNDTLMITLATCTLLYLVEMLQGRGRSAWILGLLLGLAALTKLTGFLLWIPAALVLLYLARVPGARRRWIWAGAQAFGIALLVVSPWLVQGWMTYGDPLAWSRFRDVNPRFDPLGWSDVRLYLTRMYQSFWGKFGGASQITLPAPAYVVLGAIPLLAGLGLLRRGSRSARPSGNAPDDAAPRPSREVLLLFLIWELVLLGAHLRLWTFTLGMDQARQVLAGVPPLALLGMWGLARLFKSSAAAMVAGAGMAVLATGVLFYIGSSYAPQPVNANTLPQLRTDAAARPTTVPADFGGEIRVLAFGIEPVRAKPGADVQVTVYWQAERAPANDNRLSLQLNDPEGSVATGAGVPSAGRTTTDRWRAGEVYVSRHRLALPRDLDPGSYELELGLHPPGRFDWLSVRGRDRLPIGEIRVVPP